MSASRPLVQRAREAANRRRDLYGQEPPRSVARILDLPLSGLGLYARFRLFWFLYLGRLLNRINTIGQYITDRDTPKRRRKVAQIGSDLAKRVSPETEVRTGYFQRRLYARDLAALPPFLEKLLFRTTPFVVVQPANEKDISLTLAFAQKRKLAVYPRGVASSAFGGSLPTRNGIVIDLSRQNEVLDIDAEKQTATVLPGTRWADLAQAAKPHKLMPMTNPTSRFSTIAGWVSSGGFGLHGYKYGHLKNAILSANVATPNGQIQTYDAGSKELERMIGTEGQFGVITQLTLKLRPIPEKTWVRLVTMETTQLGFELIEELERKRIEPSHLMFADTQRMVEENQLFADRLGKTEKIVPEQNAVLLHFEDRDQVKAFDKALPEFSDVQFVEGPSGRYLWAERYFPLKGQRIGPNLLAAELAMPLKMVPVWMDRAKTVAARFGIEPATEVIVSRQESTPVAVVIASYPADSSRTVNYTLRMLLVQILVREGNKLGGRPYGVGIWNSPFVFTHFSSERFHQLLRTKKSLDPDNLFNPDKFFQVRSRFANLPGLMFAPRLFSGLISIGTALSWFIGRFAQWTSPVPKHQWAIPSAEVDHGAALLEQTAHRCTHCGSCISVCPAYVLTGDERTTARAKLRLSSLILLGEVVEGEEAFSSFQCIRCGLCEEVCQTRLPLRDCYDQLEKLAAHRYDRFPENVVQDFIALVDEKRDWINRTFGLEYADWAPPDMTPKLPWARCRKGGER